MPRPWPCCLPRVVRRQPAALHGRSLALLLASPPQAAAPAWPAAAMREALPAAKLEPACMGPRLLETVPTAALRNKSRHVPATRLSACTAATRERERGDTQKDRGRIEREQAIVNGTEGMRFYPFAREIPISFCPVVNPSHFTV